MKTESPQLISGPGRCVEIKPAVDVLRPLLPILREQAASLAIAPVHPQQRNAVASAQWLHRERDFADVRQLIELFDHREFEKSGTLSIGYDAAPSVVRGCTLLRLHLRQTLLATVSDATLETGEAEGGMKPESDPAFLSYLFLCTLTEIVLKHVDITKTKGPSRIRHWLRRLLGSRRKAPPIATSADAEAQVEVVLVNDPVNLMSYVTTVLMRTLKLSRTDAERHMMEVHQAKRSAVWKGPLAQAESYAETLRGWHLVAIVRKAAT